MYLNNADITVACERPKLAKHNLEMRQSIADVMDVEVTQISMKATTTEKLGFTGTPRRYSFYRNGIDSLTQNDLR